MKIHSFISHLLVFLTILISCIIPPFFSVSDSSTQIFSMWNFPFVQFVYFLIAVTIYVFFFYHEKQRFNFTRTAVYVVLPGILTLCILFTFSLILKSISLFLSEKFLSETMVELPSGIKEWIFCLLNFLFAAFYEEVIYRFFLPESLIYFASRISSKKFFYFLSEFLSLLIFAFSHFYLGWLSVINAASGYVVLRICLIKTKNIFSGFCAHFIYNLICLLLIS
ncbi:MAG: type II CAAX endopeptidase family protein [Treponema sp.]|nr:type II CAAX endopeptidase family protein [Treponema sp.]